MALQFKKTHPEFYAAYKGTRTIVNNGSTTTQIKGIVTNQAADNRVAGAVIELVGEPFTATAGTDGVFVLKTFKAGVFSLKVSKEGYRNITIENVVVKLGQSTSVDVQLEAA